MRKKGRQGAEQIKLIGACCSSLPNSPFPRYMCLSQSALSISPVVTIASYQVVCCEWDQRNESSPCPVKRTLLQTPNPGTLQRIMLLNDHFWLHFCDLNSRWCWPLGPFHLPFCTVRPFIFSLPTTVSAITMKPRGLLSWSPKLPGTFPRNILPLKTLEPYVVSAWEEGKWCIIYIQAWIISVS